MLGVDATSLRSGQGGSTNAITLQEQANSGSAVRIDLTDEELAATLATGSNKDREQSARALFATLGSSDMQRLAQRVEEVSMKIGEDEVFGWILAREFYRRWGEVAPKDALEFLCKHGSCWDRMREAVYSGWARTTPDAAVAAYDPELESKYSRELVKAILEGLSSADPEKALRFADAQRWGSEGIFTPENEPEHRARYPSTSDLLEYVPVETPSDPFGLAIHSWIQRDPEGAFMAMLSLKYDSLRQATLGALFSNWLLRDPDAALAAIPRIEERNLREITIHRAMQAYLLRHPQEALARILALPKFEDEYEEYPFIERSDDRPVPYRFCATTRYGTLDRMGLVSEAAASMGARDGGKAWEAAATIKDDNARAAALGGVLAGWLILDTDGAARFASEGIHEGSFDGPGGSDFPGYAARLVAKRLAQRDFQNATAWVEALPSGPVREGAIETAAETRLYMGWHSALDEASPGGRTQPDFFQSSLKREYAPVAEWLDSLPASKGRDDAMSSLVFWMRDYDDPRPALKFAALIEDTRVRQRTFESLAKELLDRKDKAKSEFDLAAWSAANPGPAAELQREMDRKIRPPVTNSAEQ